MGYHTADEIPNYWAYAEHFVLQDALFEGVRSSSEPSHVEMTSEWVAVCTNALDASTCQTSPELSRPSPATAFPWANLFQLMDLHTWRVRRYHVSSGNQPDCESGAMTCPPKHQSADMPSIWNPPGFYGSVQAQGKAYLSTHNPDFTQFFSDLQGGTLPAVSWIIPDASVSEHPPATVTEGMEHVTSLVNAVMQSPDWANTAIFVTWDDLGGSYDHIAPPVVDTNGSATPVQGYGIRVPGLMISAYAKPGLIDHSVSELRQLRQFYRRFVHERRARLDPALLGIPDNRPDIRDLLTSVTFIGGKTARLGSLLNEFDFSQGAQPPFILPLDIPLQFLAVCGACGEPAEITSATVRLQWLAETAAQGTPPFTYHVVRDAAQVPVCVTTASTCTDTPGSGNHVYFAWAVDGNGVASPKTAGTEADEP